MPLFFKLKLIGLTVLHQGGSCWQLLAWQLHLLRLQLAWLNKLSIFANTHPWLRRRSITVHIYHPSHVAQILTNTRHCELILRYRKVWLRLLLILFVHFESISAPADSHLPLWHWTCRAWLEKGPKFALVRNVQLIAHRLAPNARIRNWFTWQRLSKHHILLLISCFRCWFQLRRAKWVTLVRLFWVCCYKVGVIVVELLRGSNLLSWLLWSSSAHLGRF